MPNHNHNNGECDHEWCSGIMAQAIVNADKMKSSTHDVKTETPTTVKPVKTASSTGIRIAKIAAVVGFFVGVGLLARSISKASKTSTPASNPTATFKPG